MTSLSTKEKEIVEIARSYIGTPFRAGAQVKGRRGGVDCLTLIKGVYEEWTGRKIKKVQPYNIGWFDLGTREIYYENIAKYCDFKGESWSVVRPGNILLFKFRNNLIMKHAGIATENRTMIHAYDRHFRRVVEESTDSMIWNRSLAAVFEFPDREIEE